MNGIYLMLGGNLGEVEATFRTAELLLEIDAVQILRRSNQYRTTAWPDPSQPDYLNQAIEVDWKKSPEELLLVCQSVEEKLGRVRTVRNANRTMDLDIVLWSNEVHHTPLLQIPHPRLQERLFVLEPLCDLAPAFIHPQLGLSLVTLLSKLKSG